METQLTSKPPRAVIFGCESTMLSASEKTFFKNADPLGFILFARNCESPQQVKRLVDDLRQSIGRADAPVLIDQEGGRVQRLTPPHWRKAPAAKTLVDAVKAHAPGNLTEAVRLNARLLADELSQLGITVNCLPVLDIPQSGSHDVIGDRAFGSRPEETAVLGQAVCEGLLAGGVLPVMKHIPGHGRSMEDSHKALDVVKASREELDQSDFAPFRALVDVPWAMTAHLIYNVLDNKNPATHSHVVLNGLIRSEFKYDGILLSDDVSMNALSGTIGERASRAIEAGCDLALHCNGKMDEMLEITDNTAALSADAAIRVERGEALRRKSATNQDFDVETALARLTHLTGGLL